MKPIIYAPCRIELLGGLRVRSGPAVITQFRTRKTATLLAYLAFYPGEHTREKLIEMLWPEGNGAGGRNSLNVSLTSLRNMFCALQEMLPSENPFVGVDPQTMLHADRHTVSLQRESIMVDVSQFERRLQSASLNEDAPGSVKLIGHALDCYNRLLPGFYDDWVISEAHRLDMVFFAALRRYLATLAKRGEIQMAVDYAHRALNLDFGREDVQRDLIQLLLDSGERAAALHQFQSFEEMLGRQFGTFPEEATYELARLVGYASSRKGSKNSKSVSSDRRAMKKLSKVDREAESPAENEVPSESISQPSISQASISQASISQSSISHAWFEAQVREVVTCFFENLSQRRAMSNLPHFLNSEIAVVGVSSGEGAGTIWQKCAHIYLDDLQRELLNLGQDTPFLIEAIEFHPMGGLLVAHVSISNPWVSAEQVFLFTREGPEPQILSLTFESYLPWKAA